MLGSRQLGDSGNDLLILQGKHFLADAVLAKDADMSCWIDLDLERCKVRFLKSSHEWGERRDATDADAKDSLKLKESQQSGQFELAVEHYEYLSKSQSDAAKNVIHVENSPQTKSPPCA